MLEIVAEEFSFDDFGVLEPLCLSNDVEAVWRCDCSKPDPDCLPFEASLELFRGSAFGGGWPMLSVVKRSFISAGKSVGLS